MDTRTIILFVGKNPITAMLDEEARWVPIKYLNCTSKVFRFDYDVKELNQFWYDLATGDIERDNPTLIQILKEGGPNGQKMEDLPLRFAYILTEADWEVQDNYEDGGTDEYVTEKESSFRSWDRYGQIGTEEWRKNFLEEEDKKKKYGRAITDPIIPTKTDIARPIPRRIPLEQRLKYVKVRTPSPIQKECLVPIAK